ncbi:MAG TPA: hypothetical protein ENJ28_04895 [Gammaproteobacteria bacterium]|nr:hypothetical protein [Gammaproteobacteria bacterium]
MAVVYPTTVVTDVDKMAYLIRYQHEWHQLFNKLGKWFNSGITQAEYDVLPLNVRSRVDYVPQISKAQWDYAKTSMMKVRQALVSDIQTVHTALRLSTTYSPDPTDMFTPTPAPVV